LERRSPISRQHAGPIQMIKDKIGRRPNAMIVPVEECMSSKLGGWRFTSSVEGSIWRRNRSLQRLADSCRIFRNEQLLGI
jgi:hypothetical protein